MISFFAIIIDTLIMSFINSNQDYSSFDRTHLGTTGVLVIIPIAIFFFAFCLDLNNSTDLKQFAIPLAIGLLLRIALLFFDIYGRNIYSLPNSGADTEMFYSQAIKYLSGKSTRNNLFINTLGTLFKFCGVSRVYAQFLLVVCSVVSLVVLAKILVMMKIEHRYAIRTITIIALLPNYAILSSILLRESLITMLVALSVYALAKWMVEKRWYWYFLALLFSIIGALYHSGVVAVTIGLIMIRLIYDNSNSILTSEASTLLLLMAMQCECTACEQLPICKEQYQESKVHFFTRNGSK